MPVPTKRLAGALILPQTLKLVINKKSNQLKKTIFNHLLPPLGLVLNPNSIHENSQPLKKKKKKIQKKERKTHYFDVLVIQEGVVW